MIKFNNNNTITTEPIAHPKKITGTRLAQILGINSSSTTPFQVWCDMMKVYKLPFEETKYTKAGKIIEPILAEYLRDKYNLGKDLVSPTDKYGKDYFSTTYGDFFPEKEIFGGMWDYLYMKNDKVVSQIEIKTAGAKKRKTEWTTASGKKSVPAKYMLQTGEYATLLNCDSVTIVTGFLTEKDYDNPYDFKPSDENVVIYHYRMSKTVKNFDSEYLEPARYWWHQHILSGVSPQYNPYIEADMKIVKELKEQQVFNEQLTLEATKGVIYW